MCPNTSTVVRRGSGMSLSSQHGARVVFAYLTVRPDVAVAAADETCGGDDTVCICMRVECVRSGDLRAKMHAKNQSAVSCGWRVLFGFYVKQSAWRQHVNAQWSRVAETSTWENTVREGMRLAAKHAHKGKVYVNSSAKSTPKSLLLDALQLFSNREHESTSLNNAFWRLILSSCSLAQLTPKLDEITRSLSACVEKQPCRGAATSLSAWGLLKAQL